MTVSISMMWVHSAVRLRVQDRVTVRLTLGIGLRMELRPGTGLGFNVHSALLLQSSYFIFKITISGTTQTL